MKRQIAEGVEIDLREFREHAGLAPAPSLDEADYDPAEEAEKLINQGLKHDVFEDLKKKQSNFEKAFKSAQGLLKRQKRAGMGATAAVDVVKVEILPALKEYRDELNELVKAVEGL